MNSWPLRAGVGAADSSDLANFVVLEEVNKVVLVHCSYVSYSRCFNCVCSGGVLVLRVGQRLRVDVEDLVVNLPEVVSE